MRSFILMGFTVLALAINPGMESPETTLASMLIAGFFMDAIEFVKGLMDD